MSNETNNSIIEAKKAEIEKLKKEIRQLKGPRYLSDMVHNEMIDVRYYTPTKGNGGEAWEHIRRLCIELHRTYHTHLCFSKLTNKEKKTAAEMADDIIDIWNKYTVKCYGHLLDDETVAKYTEPEKSKEVKAQKGKAQKGKARPVLRINPITGERWLFKSISDAAKSGNNGSRYQITKACESGKYLNRRKWEYYEGRFPEV